MLKSVSFVLKQNFERLFQNIEDKIIRNMLPLASEMLVPTQPITSSSQVESFFDISIWNMAAPKSKVTPRRVRRKLIHNTPERVSWYQCPKCGEPKRPHRICTKNLKICAIRDSEWVKTANVGKEKESIQ